MSTASCKVKRFVKFYNKKLYLRYENSEEEIELGKITTLKGRLTRKQKLLAVAGNGEWILI